LPRREEVAVEPREPGQRIEDFLRRWLSRYEDNRAVRVLAVAVAALLAILLAHRVLRVYRALAAPALIGAILVAGWLLIASLKASGLIPSVPRFTSEGPVVRNGVAAVVVCGKKRGFEEGLIAATKYAPEPRTGGWWPAREGECTTWYHHPPDAIQRANRHQRAELE
jgi:hypothetical protein